ncbi:MAG: hypothetical protein ACFFD4_37035 [Candidatus Odinarchaeota archaeon]
MMHKGARTIAGNVPPDLQKEIGKLLDEFGNIVERISSERRLSRAIVRSRFQCSIVAILDNENLHVLAQHHFGMPSSQFLHIPEEHFSAQQALGIARWEFGFEDPFLVRFQAALLEQSEEQRSQSLRAIAMSHIDSEFQRMVKMTSLVQINPIFGPASYSVDERLAFVLMPFDDALAKIYTTTIKPVVEKIDLICRRADEFKTNKMIMQDIWKAICEARVIIADLTLLNPNVFYELGMAHTVGKETILIYQRGKGDRPRFPFDLAHIRRIEYEDSATGGKKLETDLFETLLSILQPATTS